MSHRLSMGLVLVGGLMLPGVSLAATLPEEKLGTYVVNTGPGLDTGCTFRSGGPLVIRLNIPKIVNESQLNTDGTLLKPSEMVSNGIVSALALISFPVFDVDDKASTSGFAPEIDRVYFNGKFYETLEGANNTWTDDSLQVPIEEVRFGQDNILQIDIDTGNVGRGEYWCMAVDWVAAEFEVAAPYVLAHGIAANANTWENDTAPGVLNALDKRGVLYNRFSLGANVDGVDKRCAAPGEDADEDGMCTVASNARELQANIQKWLDELKADRVHVIAHSKGGLDTQAMQVRAPKFKLLTLSTLSTPHLGSVAADLSIIQKEKYDDIVAKGQDPNGYAKTYIDTWTFGQGPQLPGLADLTTYEATAAKSKGQRGNVGRTFTFGADADANGDNKLSAAEASPLFPAAAAYAASRAWQVLRDFSSATFTTATVPGRLWGTRTVLTYTATLAPTPQANDIVVTLSSANPSYGTHVRNVKANHGTVKSGTNVDLILDRTIPIKD